MINYVDVAIVSETQMPGVNSVWSVENGEVCKFALGNLVVQVENGGDGSNNGGLRERMSNDDEVGGDMDSSLEGDVGRNVKSEKLEMWSTEEVKEENVDTVVVDVTSKKIEEIKESDSKEEWGGENITEYTNYEVSLTAAINRQIKVAPMVEVGGKWVSASRNDVKKYLNTRDGLEEYKYQFLDLSASANIGESKLGEYLKGKGGLDGYEKSFIEAAKKHKVNEVYLVAHALLETGNGTSTMCRGIQYRGVTVYNMFGIGAVDGRAIRKGVQYAYAMGWTTREKAIEGGVEWIAKNYIHNTVYRQNTLYKMRWNPVAPGEHQYASDVRWAMKQAERIEAIYKKFDGASTVFDVALYS